MKSDIDEHMDNFVDEIGPEANSLGTLSENSGWSMGK